MEGKENNSDVMPLKNLLFIHTNILSENVEKNGKKLVEETAKFIRDPRNKKLLSSKDGQDLVRHQVMLGNYLAVKSHLEKCVKDKKAQRQLHKRILDSSLQSMKKNNNFIVPCNSINTGVSDFLTLNNQVMKAMKKTILPEVKVALSDTILGNSARAQLNFKYKFDPHFSASDSDINKILQNYPARNRGQIRSILKDYAARVKATEKKQSFSEMQNNLNRSLVELKGNTSADKLIAEIRKPSGVLLLTPTMKDRSKPINGSDLQKVLKESEEQILDEKKDTLSESTVDGLVRINPFATGEMLLKHPEYAGVICDAINKINVTDVSKAKRDRYFTLGTHILGGALLLTGVGAMAGAYILAGSLAVGLAAGTAAATVITATTAASVTLGLGSALYHGNNAYQSHREMLQLENAFITNNGDARNITDAKVALEDYKENRTAAMISLAGVGLGFVNFGKVFSMAQLGAKNFKVPTLIANSKILKAISDTRIAKKIKDALSTAGGLTSAKLDSFLSKLAESSESVRIKILELMKDSRFTSSDLKLLVEDALNAAKKCST